MAKAKRTAIKSKTKGRRKNATSAADPSNAAELLKADHRHVESLFDEYEKAAETADKRELSEQICQELIIHSMLEEDIFYPACREAGVDDELLNEAQVEHDGAKVLIADVRNSRKSIYFDAKVAVLSAYIRHHVREEEKPRSGILAQAKNVGVDMDKVGARLQQRKTELMQDAEALAREPLEAISLQLQDIQPARESTMPRYSNDRDRDEQGRFTSDDDDNRRYRSRGSSRSSRYEDDDDRSYRSSGNYRERDEQGRFMSDDDDDYERGRSSRGGRGRGGWFGDPEGHSQAARQRGSQSRSRGYYEDEDDDRGRRSSRGGRGHGGWFGDPEGHSEASELGWEHRGGRTSSRSRYDDDDNGRRSRSSRGGRGHGGWFGDSEGHSEAAELGWEHRGGRTSSRSRYEDEDDDDRRYASSRSSRGGRTHGGWYGDPEGHSEASRRGWQDRD